MSALARSSAPALQALAALPAVWRADELARNVGTTRATGHAALDAALPGSGWPVGALVEVLQAQAGQGEWRLLLPALVPPAHPAGPAGPQASARTARTHAHASPWPDGRHGGPLVLVNPPHRPFLPGLAAQGLDAARLLVLQGPALAGDPAACVWACEQALRCGGVGAVLAWLPRVRPEQLRRLQMAAQNFQQSLFVMRPLAAQHEASPAVLRLQVETAGDTDALVLRILKRRGPPLAEPLYLPARPGRLQALLAASRQQAERRRLAAGPAKSPPASVPAPAPATANSPALPDTAAPQRPAIPQVSALLAALASRQGPAGVVQPGAVRALDCPVAPAAP